MGMAQSILRNASSMTKQLPEMYQSKQLNAELDSVHPQNDVDSNDDGYDSDVSQDEVIEEEDPEWNERLLILQDASKLALLADFFLNPHKPVVPLDPYARGRNYFSRPSAHPQLAQELEEERTMILKEMKQLKQLAMDYLHPERPVVTSDPFACGRNYFARPSALPTIPMEQAEEEARILEDATQLKNHANDCMYPERPVVTTDPFACGRNYFSRLSANPYEDPETMDERNQILEDARQLKQLAVDYLHPERPVITTNPFACGRNYFTRPSATQYEDNDVAVERELILKEATQLKQLAVDYLHPERPMVTTDPCACGRNYFRRPSAYQWEDGELKAERELVLNEARQLKQLAVDYMHPERPVATTDPFACGRNYFSRPSAPQYKDDLELERELVLYDAQHRKKLTHEYQCREVPAVCTVPLGDKGTSSSAEAADPGCVLFIGMNY